MTLASLIRGQIVVAEDQLVNLEILQGYLQRLGVD